MPAPRDTSDYGQILGHMYALWALDPVVEIAHAVSLDFVARPEFYKSNDIPEAIVGLRVEYGTAIVFPNQTQRQEIYMPIFGQSDGYASSGGADKFHTLRKSLFDACSIFSERSIADAGLAMRQSILSSLELFRPYLNNFNGYSVLQSYNQVLLVSNVAFEVLRSPGIAQVFGVGKPAADSWPLESADANGALLIRAVSEKLLLAAQHVFDEDRFQRARRVAHQGREALQMMLQDEQVSGDKLEQLVTAVYTWAVSVRDFQTG